MMERGIGKPIFFQEGIETAQIAFMGLHNAWCIIQDGTGLSRYPAFVMLIMAEPWTSLVVSFDTEVKMNQLLGHGSRKLVQELVLIIGFAVNITLGAAAVKWVRRIILVSRRLR
ncbi:MAG: hypothetical protein ACR65O_10820 [Methylomicrobium sp.]